MTVKELVERETDRVKLPDWFQIPEGCEPVIGDIHWERSTRGYERGEAYVYWTMVAPFYEYGTYENITSGRWFDIKDLELVEEGED